MRNNKFSIVDDKLICISPLSFINNICLKYLKEYHQVIKCTKKLFNINKCNPLYISSSLFLIQTTSIRQYDFFAFNYFEIENISIKKNESIFYFKDGTFIKQVISKNRLNRLLKQAQIVLEYMSLIK